MDQTLTQLARRLPYPSLRDINMLRKNLSFLWLLLVPTLIHVAFYVMIFSSAYSPDLLDSPGERFLFILKLSWFTGAIVTLANIAGYIAFRSPFRANTVAIDRFKNNGWDSQFSLNVVYVSRGDNVKALNRSIGTTHRLLNKNGVNFTIHAVTDSPVAEKITKRDNVSFMVVPSSYQTRNGARYKARALHYFITQQKRKGSNKHNWVLHLDEESVVTYSSLAGIHEFITNPANHSTVGQGEIKYNNHRFASQFIIAAADSVRSGDDLGRFRFQYKVFHKPLFGMHGSYVLVPASVEQDIGFDHGKASSITEDAYFALIASERGYRFDWVNGYIREQSPFTINAFLKQRRRWFSGLWALSFDSKIALKTRLPLMINTVLWSIAWLGPVVTLLNLIFGAGYFPLSLAIIAALLQGSYSSIYLIGAVRSLENLTWPLWKRLMYYFSVLVLLPISSAMEGLAVLYAIIFPVKTFDVVRK